jgi:hypothetical protein
MVAVACGSSDSADPSPAGGSSGADGGGAGGEESVTPGSEGGGGASAGAGGSGGDGGQGGGGGAASVNAATVGFKPSNLPEDLELAVEQDMLFNGETCASRAEIDTDNGEIRCYSPGAVSRAPYFAFAVVEQSDGTEVAVFAGRNIIADAQVRIEVVGQRPLVLLAPGDIDLRGPIQAIHNPIYEAEANSGGFSSPTAARSKGLGPGGGGPGSATSGAGGGSYCGLGGLGGGAAAGAVGASGAVYGSPELVPLYGGSSGGTGSTSDSGAGGGAIQVVAGGTLTISVTGSLHVGGAAGNWGASGAGSGGSILLEGTEVVVAGILAANGGGGGGEGAGGDQGSNASPDENYAPGGDSIATGIGGIGSAANEPNGGPGGTTGGGGGGGAGRIRINSSRGTATLSGTLSPSIDTACATEGELAAN